jgi:hypothetical protein
MKVREAAVEMLWMPIKAKIPRLGPAGISLQERTNNDDDCKFILQTFT